MSAAALRRPAHGGFPDRCRRRWLTAQEYAVFHEPGAVAALAGACSLDWVGSPYMQTQELNAEETLAYLADDGWRLVRA